MITEKRIEELGVKLPDFSAPKAMYIPAKRAGNILFISGQLPTVNGELAYTGKVGKDVSLEDAQLAAKYCAINILATAKYYLEDLDKIKNIVKIQAFVNSADGFTSQHLVANGASSFLVDALGEKGMHARTAVSVNELPLNSAIEIEAILEVE